MQKTSKTILFFGNERLATGVSTSTPILKKLIEQGYDVAALIISQEDLGSKGQNPEIVEVAKAHGIKVLTFSNLRAAIPEIVAYNADTAVLAAYGKIIPESVLEIFKTGIINVHPSLLPKHRGPTPIESTIIDGDKETGVSIMKLGKAMDAGPIYAQNKIDLSGKETKQELADKLDELGAQMLGEFIDPIINGNLVPQPQLESDVSYDKLIQKQDGEIDWNLPAEQIERQIRAYSIWPRSKAQLASTEVTILEAHVIEGTGPIGSIYRDQGSFGVYTAKSILVIDNLLPAGKKIMTGQSFLAGYGARL